MKISYRISVMIERRKTVIQKSRTRNGESCKNNARKHKNPTETSEPRLKTK